jgi:hypothetical protein
MNVTACLVTRGDDDLGPVLASLPAEWERVVWNNGVGRVSMFGSEVPLSIALDWEAQENVVPDLAVYGRYAAIAYASHDVIYTQDDDVIVSDPQAIVEAWLRERDRLIECNAWGFNAWGEHVVCNTPSEFRPHYPDSGIVGFGAAFNREAPERAFARLGLSRTTHPSRDDWDSRVQDIGPIDGGIFRRRADNVFTYFTPRVLVDVPKTDREFASDPTRMWQQPGHVGEKELMLRYCRAVSRD